MKEIVINYKLNEGQRKLSLISGLYVVLFGCYHASEGVINNHFDYNFYLAAAAALVGLALILKVTWFAPKPVFVMDSEMIYSKVGTVGKSAVYRSDWNRIRDVAIGLSYLIITETGGKVYNVDLSGLKYADMKDIKSEIIEYCEAKMISYRND